MALVIPGTCSACSSFGADGRCGNSASKLHTQLIWRVACVACGRYSRSSEPASPVAAEALTAVTGASRR